MLLAIDIGNSNTVIGIFRGETLVDHWRITTSAERTADESALVLVSLLQLSAITETPTASIVSSVVPEAVAPLRQALRIRFGLSNVLVVGEMDPGMPILCDNPHEVGADRIVNAVAAYEHYRCGLIIVDFGTATTFDCVSPRGEYLGGAIAPGLTVSADALYRHTAKLPRVEIRRPARVIGRNTIDSIQAGLYFGYTGLVDGIVSRMTAELDFSPRVIATGGLARLIAGASTTITEADELMTLTGLRLLFERNALR